MTQAVVEYRSEPSDLERRVEHARARLPLQSDTALVEALSDDEIRAERELAEWIRAQRRNHRRRMVKMEISVERDGQREQVRARRAAAVDRRWHTRALTARRRAADADARFAQLHRRSEWSSRALIAVVVLGMLWAGVNVQHNLVPSGDMSDPLYWLSYGIEAMISIPIIVIMTTATTAASWGREVERGRVIVLELVLLLITLGLNAGPHLVAGNGQRAAEAAIAPTMVGVVIWLHSWVAARYAVLIEAAAPFGDVDMNNREAMTAATSNSEIATDGLAFNGEADAHGPEVPPVVEGGGVSVTSTTKEDCRARPRPVSLCMPRVLAVPRPRPVFLCMPRVLAAPQPSPAPVRETKQQEHAVAATADQEPEQRNDVQPEVQPADPQQVDQLVGAAETEGASNRPSEANTPVADHEGAPIGPQPNDQHSADLQQEAERIHLQQARAMQARGWFPRTAPDSIARVLDALKRGDGATAIAAETGVAPPTIKRIRERRDELKGVRGNRDVVRA